jgi:hypothetical protein
MNFCKVRSRGCVLHCAAPHHHLHGSIAGLDGWILWTWPNLTWADQIREFRSVAWRCIQQHTNTHNKLFSLSQSSSVFINSMLCLPFVLRCLAGHAEALWQQKLKKLFINKQTNNQSFKQSPCNKCVSKPSWGLVCTSLTLPLVADSGTQNTLLAFAYQGTLDIVFRFIIEYYSSLRSIWLMNPSSRDEWTLLGKTMWKQLITCKKTEEWGPDVRQKPNCRT